MPTIEEIKAARLAARLTQTEAGALVYVSMRGWQDWERGVRDISLAHWELFLIKTKKLRRQSGV